MSALHKLFKVLLGMFDLNINWGLEFCSCTLISYEEGSFFKNKMSIYYVLLISWTLSPPQFLLMLPHISLASAPIGMFVFVFVCLFFFLKKTVLHR